MKPILKRTIGRSEKVDLPGIGLSDLEAKTDTGAYTCSIHIDSAKVVIDGEKKMLECIFLDPAHPKYTGEVVRFEKFKLRKIKNSFGNSEIRFVVNFEISLFGKSYSTDFSLSNRDNLKFPVLLGRKLFKSRFVVDVAKYNLAYKFKQQQL